jgi:hypothetical protein
VSVPVAGEWQGTVRSIVSLLYCCRFDDQRNLKRKYYNGLHNTLLDRQARKLSDLDTRIVRDVSCEEAGQRTIATPCIIPGKLVAERALRVTEIRGSDLCALWEASVGFGGQATAQKCSLGKMRGGDPREPTERTRRDSMIGSRTRVGGARGPLTLGCKRQVDSGAFSPANSVVWPTGDLYLATR